MEFEVERLDPLFADQRRLREFTARHAQHQVKTGDLSTYKGNCISWNRCRFYNNKAALVGEDGSLLYSFYSNNDGNPLGTTIRHQGYL